MAKAIHDAPINAGDGLLFIVLFLVNCYWLLGVMSDVPLSPFEIEILFIIFVVLQVQKWLGCTW
jgi:hypothetical protein